MKYEAIVIGAGPNGLAAAIEIARTGRSVGVFEANETVGGATRSAELTLPRYLHDVCSAVHPLAASSPFFTQLPLAKHGLEFVYPAAALAHPFDDGSAIVLESSLDRTATQFGKDEAPYKHLMESLIKDWPQLMSDVLGPPRFPHHPIKLLKFSLKALRSAKGFVNSWFEDDRTRAVFAGMAAHSFLSLDQWASASFGMVLGVLAHRVGWPIVRGGSQRIANALRDHLLELGGEVMTGQRVDSVESLPPARVVLCDLAPRNFVKVAGDRLSDAEQKKLLEYRHGPGVFKMDWALSAPVPWKARRCAEAATVHLGASFADIETSEYLVRSGRHPEVPFVILAQPSLFDSSRAPAGRHTLWAYCHVPNGSTFDMSERIEQQIERFAPGFRDRVLARKTMNTIELEQKNANLVGGDINGGSQDLIQMFRRPTFRYYRTSRSDLYLCSSSTPPGGGVHGMCGYHAAQSALSALR